MPYADPEKRRQVVRDWRAKHREHTRTYGTEWRRRTARDRRAAAIEALGGVCTWCGIDDYRVLEIDHVDGGGHRERSTTDRITIWKAITDGTRRDEFQALCANCHRIKTYFPESALPR
jgi:predicted HNH restriction endonuclease